MPWDELADWWRGELADDPTYGQVVVPMVRRLLLPADRVLDVGCGDGHVMEALRADVSSIFGCDLNAHLLRSSSVVAPVVRVDLPNVACFRDGAVDAACAVLVFEHLDDLDATFEGLARVVAADGALVVVANHPLVTAPGSATVIDPTDGEVFWRPGEYLVRGVSHEPAGDHTVAFHHRSLSQLLNAAARAGWSLEHMLEVDASEHSGASSTTGLPTLLGLRFRNVSRTPR